MYKLTGRLLLAIGLVLIIPPTLLAQTESQSLDDKIKQTKDAQVRPDFHPKATVEMNRPWP